MPCSTLCNRGHQVEGIVFSCQSCPPVDWGCNETSSHSIVSLTQQIYRYEVAKQKCLGTLLYQAVYCYLFRGIRDGYIFRVLQLTFLDISYNMAKKITFWVQVYFSSIMLDCWKLPSIIWIEKNGIQKDIIQDEQVRMGFVTNLALDQSDIQKNLTLLILMIMHMLGFAWSLADCVLCRVSKIFSKICIGPSS